MIRINDFVLSTNADLTFADSPDNGSTISLQAIRVIIMLEWVQIHLGSGGTNSNAHTFQGWNHDATGTINTKFCRTTYAIFYTSSS